MFHDPVQRNALQREVERLYDQYGTAMVEDIVKGRHLPRKRVKEGRGAPITDKRRDAFIFSYVDMMHLGTKNEGSPKSVKWCYDWLGKKEVFRQWKRPGETEASPESMKASNIKRVYYRCKKAINRTPPDRELIENAGKMIFAYIQLTACRVNPLWGHSASIPGVQLVYNPDTTTSRLMDEGAKAYMKISS